MKELPDSTRVILSLTDERCVSNSTKDCVSSRRIRKERILQELFFHRTETISKGISEKHKTFHTYNGLIGY